jgi:Spy/CpxP family protein refolding chaperone
MQSRGLMFYALLLSVLLNLGVVGAAGYRAFTGGGAAPAELADRLRLDAQQRQRWHSLEEGFVRELDAGWKEIASHREKLVREVFSDTPDAARIEAERARIAQIQVQQQQRVIEQFMREREILDAGQRQALVDLLLREEHAVPRERQLHGGQ